MDDGQGPRGHGRAGLGVADGLDGFFLPADLKIARLAVDQTGYAGVRYGAILESARADLERNRNDRQWYDNFTGQDGVTHYTFAHLEQKTAALTTRFDLTMSPTLTFQVYAQPFVSKGTYTDLRELDQPRAADYDARYQPYTATDPEGFNAKQFRSNVVLRWEYRPGSTLFLVPTSTPGFRIGKVFNKRGWRFYQNAELIFENARVPHANVVGDVGTGSVKAGKGDIVEIKGLPGSTPAREREGLIARFQASDNFKLVGLLDSTDGIDRWLDRGDAIGASDTRGFLRRGGQRRI